MYVVQYSLFHVMLACYIVRSMALNEALLALKWVASPVFKSMILGFSSNFSVFLSQESVLGSPEEVVAVEISCYYQRGRYLFD